MKKEILVASLVIVVACIGSLFALNPTRFTDLKATNVQMTTLYDNTGPTARYTPGSTNAFTGDLTTTGTIKILNDAAPRTNITPAGIGALVLETADMSLCISTGTVKTTWVLVTSTTTACPH